MDTRTSLLWIPVNVDYMSLEKKVIQILIIDSRLTQVIEVEKTKDMSGFEGRVKRYFGGGTVNA